MIHLRRIHPFLLSLLAVTLTLTLLSTLPRAVVGSTCPDPSPLLTGSTVSIALLVWVADLPPGVVNIDVTETRATNQTGYGTSFQQPYMAGISMYVKEMRARNPLPLPNGQSVTLNFVYINMANGWMPFIPNVIPADASIWNYDPEKTISGYPLFMGYSTALEFPGSFMYPGSPAIPALGMPAFDPGYIHKVVSTNSTVLKAEFNITEPFTFIVPPPLLLLGPTTYLANLVEDAQSHIIIHPFLGDREAFMCDGIMDPSLTKTPDCNLRGRKEETRRFNTLFTTIMDTSTTQVAAVDHFHTLRITRMVLLHEPFFTGESLGYYASIAVQQAAKQLGIHIVGIYGLIDGKYGCNQTWCPPPAIQSQGQTMGWSEGRTPKQLAEIIAGLDPRAMIILSSPTTAGAWAIGELFRGFKELKWTPGAVSISGGGEAIMQQYMPNGADDMRFIWSTKPWDPQLNGPSYRNTGSQSDFQLFPATSELDSPAVFAEQFEHRFGPTRVGGNGKPHPFWSDPKLNSVSAIGFATLERVQKMLEVSLSRDVPTILNSVKSLSRPGIYGQVQFDPWGRTQRVNEVLLQSTPNGTYNILAPYNLGVDTIYPMPSWHERSFEVEFYSESNERVMVAINTIVLISIFVLLGVILFHHREPIIRATTPSFCVCTSVGSMLMVASNYFATLTVDDAHCAASTWMLTTGFTLTFASMFIKTFRIWKIFGRTKLTVTKLRDWELLAAVACFVLVDVIINAAWMGVYGMKATRVTVDPLRPVYDYMTCHYEVAQDLIILHLALKGGMLLFGVGITYAVRNTPSSFNESTLIGLAIYNITVCGAFGVPIVAVGLGGRLTTYLVRAFIIMFVSLSTCCLLYLPKIFILNRRSDQLTKMNGGGMSTLASTAIGLQSRSPQPQPIIRVKSRPLQPPSPVTNHNQIHPQPEQQTPQTAYPTPQMLQQHYQFPYPEEPLTPSADVVQAPVRQPLFIGGGGGGGGGGTPVQSPTSPHIHTPTGYSTPQRTPHRSPLTLTFHRMTPMQLINTPDRTPNSFDVPPSATLRESRPSRGASATGASYQVHMSPNEVDHFHPPVGEDDTNFLQPQPTQPPQLHSTQPSMNNSATTVESI